MASLFNLRAWQSICTISVQVFFGLPVGLILFISYSIYFFTQSLSSFCNTCPYHHKLFCYSMYRDYVIILVSQPFTWISISFSFMPHIHLTILISACWSDTTFSFFTGQVSPPCSILLCTQPLYNFLLTINDTSLLVSSDASCLNLFHPVQILVSTAASTSPSTLNMSPI